jgi:hypothetical protein
MGLSKTPTTDEYRERAANLVHEGQTMHHANNQEVFGTHHGHTIFDQFAFYERELHNQKVSSLSLIF